jgi:hypothetical protein
VYSCARLRSSYLSTLYDIVIHNKMEYRTAADKGKKSNTLNAKAATFTPNKSIPPAKESPRDVTVLPAPAENPDVLLAEFYLVMDEWISDFAMYGTILPHVLTAFNKKFLYYTSKFKRVPDWTTLYVVSDVILRWYILNQPGRIDNVKGLVYECLRHGTGCWIDVLPLLPKEPLLLHIDYVKSAITLISLAEHGHYDARLTTAIQNIQRRIRNLPCVSTPPLSSFPVVLPDFVDELDEKVYVRWHRECILPYLTAWWNTGMTTKLHFAIMEYLEEDTECCIFQLFKDKYKNLYLRNIDVICDPDSIGRLTYLLQIHSFGTLDAIYNPYRNAIQFTTFGHDCDIGQTLIDDVEVPTSHLLKINQMPYGTLAKLFTVLPLYTAETGLKILRQFANVKIQQLSSFRLREFMRQLCCTPTLLLLKDEEITEEQYLTYLLKPTVVDAEVRTFIRQYLTKCQNSVKAKQGIITYHRTVTTTPLTI